MASLYRRGNAFYVTYRIGGKLVRKSVGKNERTARLRLAETELALQSGRGWLPLSAAGKTLPEWLEEVLARTRTDMAPKTYARYKGIAEHLIRYFGSHEITPQGLERYKTHRLGQGVRCKTVNCELIFARSIYSGNGHNPLCVVKNLRTRDSKEIRFLSWEEAQRLIAACKCEKKGLDGKPVTDKGMRHDLADYVEAYLLTGCRLSELFVLTWADVQVDMIRVTNLKTYRSIREKYRLIPIHPRLREILESRVSHPMPFPTIRPNKLLTSIVRAARRAGLTGAVGVHTLRHTFASMLVQNGVSLFVVSKLLGHSSQRTTEIYSHLVPQTLHEAVRSLGTAESPRRAAPAEIGVRLLPTSILS